MSMPGGQVYTPLGYQAIVPTASTALTVPAGAQFALIRTEVQDVRWTDDATVPTLTVGMVLMIEDPAMWYSGDLSALLFFNDTAGSLVKISYYKVEGY